VNFHESERYLLSLGNEVSAMKLGLENITRLLSALGDPQKGYIKVQVAGTNGKGSVCAFLDSICNSANIKTGLFTSPHLISITERIRINGVDISEERFAEIATTVRDIAEDLVAKSELKYTPTFFEQVTAIALVAFADAEIELAILETGLGGRLDATTAANAEIAAVTQIDYDHQEYLGETLGEIAGEKAAIIHDGSQVVIAGQHPVAAEIINNRCAEFGIEAISTTGVRTAMQSGLLSFETGNSDYEVSKLGLFGKHQIENAKVAILVAELLQEYFPVTSQNIVNGLENARHPGRLEYQGKYLFDGAHNPAGAKALANFLDESVDKSVTIIFGVMEGKDVATMAVTLFPKAENVIVTSPDNSRAMSPKDITASLPKAFDKECMTVTATVEEALQIAQELAGRDGLILVTGSLYLVGEAKKILNN
jgi:dihydrofolate synthase/folylpolyglutamate synthase